MKRKKCKDCTYYLVEILFKENRKPSVVWMQPKCFYGVAGFPDKPCEKFKPSSE